MGIRLFRVVVAAGVLLAGIVVAGPTGAATPTAVVVPSPSPGANVNYLHGVACVSDTDCWAVGYFEVSAKQHTLVEHWDGMQWLVVPSPNVASMENSQLRAVTCLTSTNCVAVGDSWTLPSDDLSATLDTLIERWDGSTWSIVPSPNGDPSHVGLYRFLESVTCPSLARCIAVGHTETGGPSRTFVLQWDGVTWTWVATPNRHGYTGDFGSLSSVACNTTTSCYAVGSSTVEDRNNVFHRRTLVEHWNGSTWKIVASPNPVADTRGSYLEGIACNASISCFATGYFVDAKHSRTRTLVEHWNGTAWKVTPSPTPAGRTRARLSAVKCTSTTNCLAVGSHLNASARKLLLEHWDGTRWSQVSEPAVTGFDVSLQGVACAGATCFAVGSRPSGGRTTTLIVRYS